MRKKRLKEELAPQYNSQKSSINLDIMMVLKGKIEGEDRRIAQQKKNIRGGGRITSKGAEGGNM